MDYRLFANAQMFKFFVAKLIYILLCVREFFYLKCLKTKCLINDDQNSQQGQSSAAQVHMLAMKKSA